MKMNAVVVNDLSKSYGNIGGLVKKLRDQSRRAIPRRVRL
jgi:hypothetical protein